MVIVYFMLLELKKKTDLNIIHKVLSPHIPEIITCGKYIFIYLMGRTRNKTGKY